ncbi:glycosyltransferase [Leifsonia sp. NPDC058292]|uniref:glycosyltransferase n=1 Tax=Leifsonia sp. NPDC058292 TaxID=3346428 RepID=UPI0036DB76D1
MRRRIRHLVVVVPARNEEATLDACLRSIAVAAERIAPVTCTTVLVLDACTDGSREIAARHPSLVTIERSFENVGLSRAAGVEAGLRLANADPRTVWIATTDADSEVPPGWLARNLRAARDADVFVGAVVPVLHDLDDSRRDAWVRIHPPGATLGHVHGANLGVRADVYLRSGGFAALARDEDVTLVERLRAGGARVAESEDDPVVTSSRLEGRVSGGYAQYLNDLGLSDLAPT